MANLGYMLKARGDLAAAEHWDRQGAALGGPGATENLARLLKDRGQLNEAVEWYRKAANQAMNRINTQPGSYRPWPGESEDEGVSDAILRLAETLAETDTLDEAEYWFREIAERGDARAAAAMADIYTNRGEPAAAAAWRRTAADLANTHLTRNKRSLQMAYGEPGVLRHVPHHPGLR